jgi:hypothetical protein
VRDRGLQGVQTVIQRQERVATKCHQYRLLASLRTDERGSFGPVLGSSTVSRLRHFATILGLIPSSRISAAVEACVRSIAARMARMVMVQP